MTASTTERTVTTDDVVGALEGHGFMCIMRPPVRNRPKYFHNPWLIFTHPGMALVLAVKAPELNGFRHSSSWLAIPRLGVAHPLSDEIEAVSGLRVWGNDEMFDPALDGGAQVGVEFHFYSRALGGPSLTVEDWAGRVARIRDWVRELPDMGRQFRSLDIGFLTDEGDPSGFWRYAYPMQVVRRLSPMVQIRIFTHHGNQRRATLWRRASPPGQGAAGGRWRRPAADGRPGNATIAQAILETGPVTTTSP